MVLDGRDSSRPDTGRPSNSNANNNNNNPRNSNNSNNNNNNASRRVSSPGLRGGQGLAQGQGLDTAQGQGLAQSALRGDRPDLVLGIRNESEEVHDG